jgi:hypothetical protein
MDSQTIAALLYVNGEGVIITLKRYQVGVIKTFKRFLYHRANLGKSLLTMEDWDTLDHEAINDFRVSTSGWSCRIQASMALPRATYYQLPLVITTKAAL